MEHHEKRKKRRNVANEHSRGTLRTGVRRRQGTTSSHSIAQSRSQKRRADYVEPGSTKRRKKGNSTPATDFEVTTDCFGANSNLAEAEKSDAPLLGGAERGCEAEYEVRMQRFRTIVDYCLARQLKLSPGDVSQLKALPADANRTARVFVNFARLVQIVGLPWQREGMSKRTQITVRGVVPHALPAEASPPASHRSANK